MSDVLLAWHYTIGGRADSILRDGFIRPATAGVTAGEKPIVWFSTRQRWEPTATKGVADHTGRSRWATMDEMLAEGGLWRFGIPASELLPWERLRRSAAITKECANALVRSGRKAGSDPFFWYGSLEPVAIERCVIECQMAEPEGWRSPG